MPAKIVPATGAERVRDHHERQLKRGLKLIRVWVPGDGKSGEQVRRLAADLRKKAGMPLLHDWEIPASPKPHAAPKPQRKRKRRPKKQPSNVKPAQKAERAQKQNPPKTPKKRRNQRRREAEKAARARNS